MMRKDILCKIAVMAMDNIVKPVSEHAVREPGKTDRLEPSGERDDRHSMKDNGASFGLRPAGKQMGFTAMSGDKTLRYFKRKFFSPTHLTVIGTENGNAHRG
jgi:hypothetical protein